MTQGLVSIVIPTFDDDPGHLEEAVASALLQVDVDVEVVVVDDGSTRADSLGWLAAPHADVTVVRQANAGPGAARNAGIAASSGEYVMTLDADDTVSALVASEGVRALVDPAVAVAFPGLTRGGQTVALPPEVRLSDIALFNVVPSCGVFRRADFDATPGYPTDDQGPEDWHLWLSLLLLTGGVMRQVPGFLTYRERPGSRSTTIRDGANDAAWRAAFRRHPDHQEALFMALAEHADHLRGRTLGQAEELATWRRRLGWAAPVAEAAGQVRRQLGGAGHRVRGSRR